ncbi:MAG: 50S ribosomal protein L25 [Dehalococcoidales bacterium]|jgi:large subunit ribosomal protein L25|nr:50S ribosomal protein L25 [Dehalococcoidales bacterium]|tara:strand:- start:324 stop:989 length:666 start_codon:yes stop_codon:yes gene_type:complete
MTDLTLQVTKRDILGKKVRFLRRQDITPAHLFGHGLESLSLQCDTDELQRIIAQAGTTRLINLKIDADKQPRSVFIREIQREIVKGQLLHVDFYQVRKTEKIKADIPIVLVGEAPAMSLKGRILTHTLNSLSIECLPDKLPPQIEVDLSPLEELEQAIHVRDITLSPDITVFTDPDQVVAKVSEARVIEEVVAEVEVEAEEEVEATAKEEAAEEPEQQPQP